MWSSSWIKFVPFYAWNHIDHIPFGPPSTLASIEWRSGRREGGWLLVGSSANCVFKLSEFTQWYQSTVFEQDEHENYCQTGYHAMTEEWAVTSCAVNPSLPSNIIIDLERFHCRYTIFFGRGEEKMSRITVGQWKITDEWFDIWGEVAARWPEQRKADVSPAGFYRVIKFGEMTKIIYMAEYFPHLRQLSERLSW